MHLQMPPVTAMPSPYLLNPPSQQSQQHCSNVSEALPPILSPPSPHQVLPGTAAPTPCADEKKRKQPSDNDAMQQQQYAAGFAAATAMYRQQLQQMMQMSASAMPPQSALSNIANATSSTPTKSAEPK